MARPRRPTPAHIYKRTYRFGWAEEEIDLIQNLYYKKRFTISEIAAMFGIPSHYGSIQRVVRGEVKKVRPNLPSNLKWGNRQHLQHPLCGSRAGYLKHRRENEEPCDDCKVANAQTSRNNRAKAAERCPTCRHSRGKDTKQVRCPKCNGWPLKDRRIIGWRKSGNIRVAVWSDSPDEHKRAMRPVRPVA